MRARQYRPIFDSLDSRLLLSDTSVGFTSNVAVVEVAPSTPSTLATNDEPSLLMTQEWLLPGTPPDDHYDPTIPTQGGAD